MVQYKKLSLFTLFIVYIVDAYGAGKLSTYFNKNQYNDLGSYM